METDTVHNLQDPFLRNWNGLFWPTNISASTDMGIGIYLLWIALQFEQKYKAVSNSYPLT